MKGGTVTISTRENEDDWIITVADDGVGFTPDAPLHIDSEPGKGTAAKITIPKGGKHG